MKSGRSGAHKPDKLGLSCNANKCSDAGTGDLGVLRTHGTSPCLGDAGSTRPAGMPPQVQVSKVIYTVNISLGTMQLKHPSTRLTALENATDEHMEGVLPFRLRLPMSGQQ